MKKGVVWCIWALCLSASVQAQQNLHYALADAHTSGVQHHRPDSLSYLLTQPFSTDTLLQVRAIFRWVTENISYNTSYGKRGASPKVLQVPEEGSFQTLDQRVAWQVLQRRTAVCEGYARLFKTLCDYAGIRCELVQGFVKNSWESTSKQFTTNHTWNAVYINGSWQQLDATWASGYTSVGGSVFTKQFDESYFLVPPGTLLATHYPEHFWWTTQQEGLLWAEYRFTPFRFHYFITHRIQQFSPLKGIVQAGVGDTVQFSIKPLDDTRTCYLTTNPYDAAAILHRSSHFKKQGGAIQLQYTVVAEVPHWLYVVHNDDVVLRYFVQPVAKQNLVQRHKAP